MNISMLIFVCLFVFLFLFLFLFLFFFFLVLINVLLKVRLIIWPIEYRSDDVTKNFFFFFFFFFGFQCFGYHVSVEQDENINSPNWVGIGSRGPEIWPHEYLISPIEISVNWSGSKQLSRATMNQFMSNLVCGGFHHVLLKYCHENAEMQKRKFDDVTLQYSIIGQHV